MRAFFGSLLFCLLALVIPINGQTDEEHPCYPYELIICRATTEPSPLGAQLGPRTKDTIEAILGESILVVGLIYPASFDIPESPETGIRNLVTRIRSRAEQCPDIKFALTGYSQGADVIHHSLQQLAELQDRIAAIAMFGDPLTSVGFPPAYEGRVYNTCNSRDRACGGRGTIGHLAYGRQPEAYEPAVDFIVERLQEASPPVPSDPRPTLAALPPAGDAADFLNPLVTWPPRDWAQQYTDGWVAEPVWV
ncbi:hypothetical protein VTO42DRAFT_5538 [Malbranchea cinnamomea]